MRVTAIVFLLALAFVVAASASDQPAPAVTPDTLRSPATPPLTDQVWRPPSSKGLPPHTRAAWPLPFAIGPASTCLTMRSYIMQREAPDSDVTRPAGYQTCTPASRFQVKAAVDTKTK